MLTETLPRIPFSAIGPTSHCLQGKWASINLSDFGMIVQYNRQLPVSIFSDKIAALGSLKRFTGRILKLVSFKGASKKFEFDFFINLEQKF
jgi:hypothetical protein